MTFSMALFELTNGPVRYSSDRLSSLKFNPLISPVQKHLALSPDLDPDVNFYSGLCDSDFYTEDQFNECVAKNFSKSDCLSFLHLNIRSLSRNLCNLTNLLSNINTKFSIVGISETWLKNSSHLVDIDGYNFVQNHRTDKCGGGVELYLSLDLEFLNPAGI